MNSDSVPGGLCGYDGCQHHVRPIPKKNTCHECDRYLHDPSFGCSIQIADLNVENDDDDNNDGGDGMVVGLQCQSGHGCQQKVTMNSETNNEQTPVKATSECDEEGMDVDNNQARGKNDDGDGNDGDGEDDGNHNDDDDDDDDDNGNDDDDKAQQQDLDEHEATTPSLRSKRGPKKGTKRTERGCNFWYNLCEKYLQVFPDMSQKQFLKSSHSGIDIGPSQSDLVSFGRYLKEFKTGKLMPTTKKRRYVSKYQEIEEKLIRYVRQRLLCSSIDKYGVSSQSLQDQCAIWARGKYTGFKPTADFITGCLERHNILGFSLPSRSELPADERLRLIVQLREEIITTAETFKIEDLGCIYNAYQTGLFYSKLPNRWYLKRNQHDVTAFDNMRPHVKGNTSSCNSEPEAINTKYQKAKIKRKERISIMVAVSADGRKVPLLIVGQERSPHCFRLCESGEPPMPYRYHPKAWFDTVLIQEWINDVFWPFHLETKGNVDCILTLNRYCGQSTLDKHQLPEKLHIVYLPSYIASQRQPTDLGVVMSLKVGYRSALASVILSIFDAPGGFEQASKQRRLQPVGCRGLYFGGKVTILDAMTILHDVWSSPQSKFANADSIVRNWRKADIIPPQWKARLNIRGRIHLTPSKRQVTNELCSDLRMLLKKIIIRVRATLGADTVHMIELAPILNDSFATEGILDDREIREMVDQWIEVEDREEVVESEIREELAAMEVWMVSTVNVGEDGEIGNETEPHVVVPPEIQDDEDDDEGDPSYPPDSDEPKIATLLDAEQGLAMARVFMQAENATSDEMRILDRLAHRLREMQHKGPILNVVAI